MPKKKYYPGYQSGSEIQVGSEPNVVERWLERMRESRSSVGEDMQDLMDFFRGRRQGMGGGEYRDSLDAQMRRRTDPRGFLSGGRQGPRDFALDRPSEEDRALEEIRTLILEGAENPGFADGGIVGLQEGSGTERNLLAKLLAWNRARNDWANPGSEDPIMKELMEDQVEFPGEARRGRIREVVKSTREPPPNMARYWNLLRKLGGGLGSIIRRRPPRFASGGLVGFQEGTTGSRAQGYATQGPPGDPSRVFRGYDPYEWEEGPGGYRRRGSRTGRPPYRPILQGPPPSLEDYITGRYGEGRFSTDVARRPGTSVVPYEAPGMLDSAEGRALMKRPWWKPAIELLRRRWPLIAGGAAVGAGEAIRRRGNREEQEDRSEDWTERLPWVPPGADEEADRRRHFGIYDLFPGFGSRAIEPERTEPERTTLEQYASGAGDTRDARASVGGPSPADWQGYPYRLPPTDEGAGESDFLQNIMDWRPDYGDGPTASIPPAGGALTAVEEEELPADDAPPTLSSSFAELGPDLREAILADYYGEERELTPELSPIPEWDQEARDLVAASASKRPLQLRRRLSDLMSGPREFELGQEGSWDPRTAEVERRLMDPTTEETGFDLPNYRLRKTTKTYGDPYNRNNTYRHIRRGRQFTGRPSMHEPAYPGGPTLSKIMFGGPKPGQSLRSHRERGGMSLSERREHQDKWREHQDKQAALLHSLQQAGLFSWDQEPGSGLGPNPLFSGNADGGIVGLENGGPTPNPTQTQVTSSYVNPAIGKQTADLTDRIVAEGDRPYQQYTGQRIAGFTQPEAIAQQAAINYGMGMGPQGTQQAGTTLAGAGQMIQGAQQGLAGLQPQYQQLAGRFGTAAQGALGQAQAGAQGMQNLAGRAELQGQLAGAGMRQTGAAAQTEQQALGAGQAAAGQAGQALMTGFGQQMGQAGQQALGGQQDYAAGMTGMGTAAQQAGQAGQAQFGQIGGQVGQLGTDIRSQLGGTGLQAQQAGQIGAADIRAAGLEGQQAALAGQGAITGVGSRAGAAGAQTAADIQAAGAGAQQLGQQALSGITGVGGQAQQQAAQAAQRMRDIGGQGPELGKSADMSDYMSQYTGAVTDPQLRQLMEFQKAQGQELGAQAAGAGAFGGYRQGIMQQQQAQEGAQQAADIIGKGQQEAFQSAVGREREDARRREQAQQMGLSAEQQAAAAQAGAQGQALQAQQAGFGAAATGQQQAQQAAQAAGAARQAGLGAEQQAQIAGMGVAQAGQAGRQAAAQQAVQAQQQGISALQQAQQAGGSAAQQAMGQQLQAAQQGQAAGQAGRAAQMQAQRQAAGMADVGAGRQMQGIQGQGALTGQGVGMGMQGLAAQQGAAAQGAQFGLQGQQQGYQAAQGGTQLGLAGLQQAGQLGQQGYGTMGQLMGRQQGAIGAQGGAFAQMGGMGAQLAGVGGQQMGLGAQQQRQQYERIGQMGQAGADQRALQQQSLNMGYQDWQNQLNQERQNIDWQQRAMGQLPYQSTVAQSVYGGGTQTPGWQQIAGAGLYGAGMANQMNRPNQNQGS